MCNKDIERTLCLLLLPLNTLQFQKENCLIFFIKETFGELIKFEVCGLIDLVIFHVLTREMIRKRMKTIVLTLLLLQT